jgi:hypothetical protein
MAYSSPSQLRSGSPPPTTEVPGLPVVPWEPLGGALATSGGAGTWADGGTDGAGGATTGAGDGFGSGGGGAEIGPGVAACTARPAETASAGPEEEAPGLDLDTATGVETSARGGGAATPPVPTSCEPPRATTVASPSAALVRGDGIRVGTIVEVAHGRKPARATTPSNIANPSSEKAAIPGNPPLASDEREAIDQRYRLFSRSQ